MGWGEAQQSRSARMVRQNARETAAVNLATMTRRFLAHPTTGNRDRLARALADWDTLEETDG